MTASLKRDPVPTTCAGFGIRTRLTLGISAFLIVILTAIFWGFSTYVFHLTRGSIQQQQYAMTELIARSIDDKLGTYLHNVTRLTLEVQPELFRDRAGAQAFLDQKRDLLSTADGTIFLLAPDYTIVASSPAAHSKWGSSIPEITPFLKKVREEDFPDISHPFLCPVSNTPTVIVASPIVVGDKFLGFLAGSINLTKDYFIEELMGYQIGSQGYLYLFDTDRTMIFHPDQSRIMKNDIPQGANKLLDQVIGGFDGSGETIDCRGVPQITSFKRLRVADWILACSYPQSEAYAPIRRLRSYLFAIAFLVASLSVGLVWLLTRRMTAGLNSFTQQVLQLRAHPENGGEIDIDSSYEVTLLADSFNSLMSELKKSRGSLENMTRTDPMTGLFNRRHLALEAPKLIKLSERDNSATGIFLVDIDHFKGVNDTLGHDVGDTVVIQVANLLQNTVRIYDLVVRYGGDEFVVVLPKITMEESMLTAERVRTTIAGTPIQSDHGEVSVTVSVGIYVSHSIPDLAHAIACADKALYRAKDSGRNKVCTWNEKSGIGKVNRKESL